MSISSSWHRSQSETIEDWRGVVRAAKECWFPESAYAMGQVVCEQSVAEDRLCHGNDVERPVPTNLAQENSVEELTREWCEPTKLQRRLQ